MSNFIPNVSQVMKKIEPSEFFFCQKQFWKQVCWQMLIIVGFFHKNSLMHCRTNTQNANPARIMYSIILERGSGNKTTSLFKKWINPYIFQPRSVDYWKGAMADDLLRIGNNVHHFRWLIMTHSLQKSQIFLIFSVVWCI